MVNEEQFRWCVYIHTNKINGKKYVGITRRCPNERWHNGKGYNGQIFGKAVNKYGWDNFKHDIVETNLSKEDALKSEREYIQKFHTTDKNYGYNISEGGDLPPRMYGEDNPFYGKVPIKAIEASVAARKGTHLPEEVKNKISNSMKKYTKTDEHRKHLSESKKGKTVSSGADAPRATKVMCEETGMIFGCQKELAEYLGVCRAFVCRIIKEHTCHRGVHYILLAKA